MIIDVAKCHRTAITASWPARTNTQETTGVPFSIAQPLARALRWMNIHAQGESGSYPLVDVAYRPHALPCTAMMPDCIKAAKDGAVSAKREDGIVIIDPEKAKGQKGPGGYACPYGAIWWNAEKAMFPQKCTFCAAPAGRWLVSSPVAFSPAPPGPWRWLYAEDASDAGTGERGRSGSDFLPEL